MAFRKRVPKQPPTDPATRAFYERERCEVCGEDVRKMAMDVHQRSTRCELGRISREMHDCDWSILPTMGLDDWNAPSARWIIDVLMKARVPYKDGPIGVSRFDEVEFGFWAPTWACLTIVALRGVGYQATLRTLAHVRDNPEIQSAVCAAALLVDEDDDKFAPVRRILWVES